MGRNKNQEPRNMPFPEFSSACRNKTVTPDMCIAFFHQELAARKATNDWQGSSAFSISTFLSALSQLGASKFTPEDIQKLTTTHLQLADISMHYRQNDEERVNCWLHHAREELGLEIAGIQLRPKRNHR